MKSFGTIYTVTFVQNTNVIERSALYLYFVGNFFMPNSRPVNLFLNFGICCFYCCYVARRKQTQLKSRKTLPDPGETSRIIQEHICEHRAAYLGKKENSQLDLGGKVGNPELHKVNILVSRIPDIS